MSVQILIGDCREKLRELPAGSAQVCVSSPPYFGLRDYQAPNQIGLEQSPTAYVKQLVAVFRDVRRVLRDDGTVFLNLGDSYAGSWGAQSREHAGKHGKNVSALSANQVRAAARKASGTGRIPKGSGLKPKDLIGVPWRVALALQADGWWLRSEIIWAKPNAMPGSQDDRCTSSHEVIFMLSKSEHYWSDYDAIKTPPREAAMVRQVQDNQAQAGSDKQRGHGRKHAGFNARWDSMSKAEQRSKPAMMRDVWFVSPASFTEPHFAVMPDEIARRCILAGAPAGGVVMDPFGGAGTTGLVAAQLGRNAILIEINPAYAAMAQRRLKASFQEVRGADETLGLEPLPLFGEVAA